MTNITSVSSCLTRKTTTPTDNSLHFKQWKTGKSHTILQLLRLNSFFWYIHYFVIKSGNVTSNQAYLTQSLQTAKSQNCPHISTHTQTQWERHVIWEPLQGTNTCLVAQLTFWCRNLAASRLFKGLTVRPLKLTFGAKRLVLPSWVIKVTCYRTSFCASSPAVSCLLSGHPP